MRWDDLFRDLEAQLVAAEAADLTAEVADRTRRESALLTLADRARGAVGSRVAVQVSGAGQVEGLLVDVGLGLAAPVRRRQVATCSCRWPPCSAWPGWPCGQVRRPVRWPLRLGLGSALRALARDRARVTVHLVDGSAVAGTIDRVGADFLEVSDRSGEAAGARPQRCGPWRPQPSE